VDIQPAPSKLRDTSFNRKEFDAKAIGSHETLYELVSGKLYLIDAINKVNIVGDFGKLLSQLDGFLGFLKFLSTMDIEP
jgi:hypothetical protein